MSVSADFRRWVRDTSIGKTDADVCELADIGFATWRRMLAGHIPSEPKIIAYAIAMGVDPAEGLALARRGRLIGCWGGIAC